jgi:DNA-binding transcriptional MerR regulator
MSINTMSLVWKMAVKGNQKLILLALADHADDEGICWPGVKGIAKKCGVSRSSVIDHLKKLECLGLLSKQKRNDEHGYRRSNLYVLNLDITQSPEIQRRKNQRRDSDNQSPIIGPSRVQDLDGNNINHSLEPSLEPSNTCEVETSPCVVSEIDSGTSIQSRSKGSAEVKEIFQYWQTVMNKPLAKLDAKRKGRITQALKLGFSIEQLKQAVNGCANSAFHTGGNEQGKRYDSLELILRNAEKIESFIDMAQIPTNGRNASSRHSIFAGAL